MRCFQVSYFFCSFEFLVIFPVFVSGVSGLSYVCFLFCCFWSLVFPVCFCCLCQSCCCILKMYACSGIKVAWNRARTRFKSTCPDVSTLCVFPSLFAAVLHVCPRPCVSALCSLCSGHSCFFNFGLVCRIIFAVWTDNWL